MAFEAFTNNEMFSAFRGKIIRGIGCFDGGKLAAACSLVPSLREDVYLSTPELTIDSTARQTLQIDPSACFYSSPKPIAKTKQAVSFFVPRIGTIE